MDTALSRLTGKPPLWGCGMTPSTVSGDFVAAVTNAGYSIELAGGGHFSEEMVRNKIDLIRSKVEPGQGILKAYERYCSELSLHQPFSMGLPVPSLV